MIMMIYSNICYYISYFIQIILNSFLFKNNFKQLHMKNVLEAIKFFKNKNFEDITPSGYSNIFAFMQKYDEKKGFCNRVRILYNGEIFISQVPISFIDKNYPYESFELEYDNSDLCELVNIYLSEQYNNYLQRVLYKFYSEET